MLDLESHMCKYKTMKSCVNRTYSVLGWTQSNQIKFYSKAFTKIPILSTETII